MKVYLVEYTCTDTCGVLKDRYVLEVFANRQSAHLYMIGQSINYASANYHVYFTHSGVYIDKVKAEKEEWKESAEIVEITVMEAKVNRIGKDEVFESTYQSNNISNTSF